GREVLLVAILGDLGAPHQLHHEIRTAVLRRPGIEHLGDVGMVHHRQRLPLGLEAGDDALGVHAQLDDLEGDTAADRFFLFGHVHDTHAYLADFFHEFVSSYSFPGTDLGYGKG